MKKRETIWVVLLLLGLLATVVIIYPWQQSSKSTVLEATADTPPCWYQICPGQSTREEALAALKAIPVVDADSVADLQGDQGSGNIFWWFKVQRSETSLNPVRVDYSGRCYYKDEIITHIEIYPGGLTMREVVDKFGEPELVAAVSGWADTRWLEIALLYPSRGIAFTYFDGYWQPSRYRAQVKPGYQVGDAIFFAPEMYDDLLLAQEVMRGVPYQDVVEAQQPWAGFGEIRFVDMSSR